jgi:pimeloyl-ACP methyl ester carboxylesterase
MKITLNTGLMIIKHAIYVFGLCCLMLACEENQFQSVTKEVRLVSLQDPYRLLPGYKFTVSTTTLKSMYEEYGITNPDSFIKYPVSYHRLVYTTTYKGQQINASGAMVIPVRPDTIPAIVCFQHGTMFADRDVPSDASSHENSPLFNEYVLFLPDYIGYGESKSILHPYLIEEISATSVIDMIIAGKEYLDDNHILYKPDKLFLTGHSEGGFVTLAVQKALESNPVDGLKVTASAPCAGPYDVEFTAKRIFQYDSYPSPSYLILILSSYNEYYSWLRPITDFIESPYSSTVMNLLSGLYNEEEINTKLTTDLSVLLNPLFLSDVRGEGEIVCKEMFELNNVNDWAPSTPTRLYHGTDDDLVPFEISQHTYISFISNGADPDLVRLVPLPNIDHDYIPAYLKIIEWFKTF